MISPGRSGVLRGAIAAVWLAAVSLLDPVSAQTTIRPGWGFNWRLRDRASCRLIDASVLPSCSRCRETPNAYQGGIDGQACYLVPNFEYVIFPTEADCQRGLELMKKGNAL